MQIDIKSYGFEMSNTLRGHIEREISSSFQYMERKMSNVVVRLFKDSTSTKQNINSCRVQAVVNGLPHVITEFRSKNFYHAAGVAILRSKRAITKKLNKRRELRKRRAVDKYLANQSANQIVAV